MKTRNFFTFLAAAAALLACNKTEADMQQPAKGQAIRLTSQVGTKATSDPQGTQLSTAVTVGVFGISDNAAISNGNNNAYTVEANATLSANTEMVWPSEGSVSIYAYAPYQQEWVYNQANSFSVATDQATEAGYLTSDLLYGTPASNPVAQTEDPVALNFTHKLTKLNISIQKAQNATLDLSEAIVTLTNTKITTSLNPSTGAIGEATGDATDIQLVSALGNATTACGILVPQEIAAGTALVRIVADGKTLIAKLAAATTFVGGKSYNFTVQIGAVTEPVTEVTLQLGSTTLVGWDDEDLGEAEADGKLYATFGTPGSNGSYDANTFTYTWTAGNSNLMNCFTFENGELANYTTLHFAFTEITDGKAVRINILYSDNSNNDKNYYTVGTKNEAISGLLKEGKTAADVTAIRFGGANISASAGSCVVKASEMYLE